MRAIRFHGIADVRAEAVVDPEPGAEDVIIAVEAAGMCGTDTHIVDGHFFARPPRVIGHEFAGRIVETGSQVDRGRVGELVTAEPHEYDRTCLYCQIGKEHMCVNKQAYGVHLDGGMAELVKLPARLAYPLPQGISPQHGALTEPVACCVHAMDRLAPQSGLPIGIHGCGPVGAILIGLSKLAGLYPIVACDPRADRRALAARCGADVVLDPASADFDARVEELTDGYGFIHQIDAVGSPAVIEKAVTLSSRAGTILFFGVAAPEATATVFPNEIYAKELTLLGTAINPYTHRRAVGVLERLPLSELTTAAFAISQVDEAFVAQRSGAADKIFIDPKARV